MSSENTLSDFETLFTYVDNKIQSPSTLSNIATVSEDGEAVLGRVDHYVFRELLGEGGFGKVYRATDEVAGRDIAVKLLPAHVSLSADSINEIKDNFKLVASLNHPNIANVSHLHQARTVSLAPKGNLEIVSGTLMIIMEYVQGVTLNTWQRGYKGKCVPFDEALAVCSKVADALVFAHSEMIVHRDIKPTNIMLTRDGKVKVLDFGIASQVRVSLSRMSIGEGPRTGTPTHMSPEQWGGKRQGPATDQYALATMFYELISGEIPFVSALDVGFEAMARCVINTEPEAPYNLSDILWTVLKKALSKDPSDRYSNCKRLFDQLEAVAKNGYDDGKLLLEEPGITVDIRARTAGSMKLKANKLRDKFVDVYTLGDKDQISSKIEDELYVLDECLRLREYSEVLACCETIEHLVAKAFGVLASNDLKENKQRDLFDRAYHLAEKGDIDAQFNVGVKYHCGRGVGKDLNLACYWYFKAAEDGHAKAQCSIGQMYVAGLGVEKDYSEALEWFMESSNQGEARAQNCIGGLYLKGQGVPCDKVEAVKWFRKAAEQGHDLAQLNLGIMLIDGNGVKQDKEEACEWWRKSSDQGNSKAAAKLSLHSSPHDTTQGLIQEQASDSNSLHNFLPVGLKSRKNNEGQGSRYNPSSNDHLAQDLDLPSERKVWGMNLKMTRIEPGAFNMGISGTGISIADNPTVTITRPYLMGLTPVTQEEYMAVVGDNPSKIIGDRNPVDFVRWTEATEFCRIITKREQYADHLPDGYEYRLPTEAEWEFAARGGKTSQGYRFSGSNSWEEVAWFANNSSNISHKVALKKPNELGLFDMSGNINEWCLDRVDQGDGKKAKRYQVKVNDPLGWSGVNHVTRGKSWSSLASYSSVVSRSSSALTDTYNTLGFRIVLGPVFDLN